MDLLERLGDPLPRLQRSVECRDGTTHLIFEPLDFIARLADLVPKTLALFAEWALPKPRVNRTYFQGVFAPNSLYCAQETPHHDRQRLAFTRVHALVSRDYVFVDKAAVRDYFTRLAKTNKTNRGQIPVFSYIDNR